MEIYFERSRSPHHEHGEEPVYGWVVIEPDEETNLATVIETLIGYDVTIKSQSNPRMHTVTIDVDDDVQASTLISKLHPLFPSKGSERAQDRPG